MKKTSMIFGFAFLAAIALSSCKKDYTCECKSTDNSFTAELTYTKVTKKTATDACDTWNNSTGAEVTCKIK